MTSQSDARAVTRGGSEDAWARLAERQRQKSSPPAPATVPTSLSWRAAWMSSCGEDTFGGWAAATIAGVEVRFRYCPAGKFRMGSPASEAGRSDDEGPQHGVTLTPGFWLGEAPVTQRQWQAVAGSNPIGFRSADLPVEQVSWHECEAWMAHASARAVGLGLRFPAEAEWEYACRAGTTGATYRGGNDAATLDAIAWYAPNSGSTTHPVKQKSPNPGGLYEMLGNVSEWCGDSQRRYILSATTDPNGGVCSVAARGAPARSTRSTRRPRTGSRSRPIAGPAAWVSGLLEVSEVALRPADPPRGPSLGADVAGG